MGQQNFGKYGSVVIVLACIIFSAFASDPPAAVNADTTAVQAVWSYVIQLVFNLLVLVGAVKMSERLTKEILGLQNLSLNFTK